MSKKNYLIDRDGKPYIQDESWPAGGGLDRRCDHNAHALYAFDVIGKPLKIEDYLCDHDFDIERDEMPFMQSWTKGNTRIVFESYADGLWGYVHTELINN